MGLGSGRRGMKSPPLIIAVLLACVFVLGINYWITSSRCIELQARVVELEGRMRRAAAERGAVEMKKNEYEDMLAKQKTQIDDIQSLHSSQMQDVHSRCNTEKESLLSNVTYKDNFIQKLQVQISNLHKSLEESKMGFKELQESQTQKLSYELTQCGSKINEVKELCDEQLRKAGVKDGNAVNEDTEKTITEAKNLKPTIIQEINQKKDDENKEEKPELTPLSNDEKKAENKEETNNLELNVEEKKPWADPRVPGEEINPDNVNAPEEDDEPKVEDVEDKEIDKENEEVERENLINIDGQQEDDKGSKQNGEEEGAENPNDYNGDETNVAESEAEKQAQLNDNSQNLKDDKVPNGLNGLAADQVAQDNEHPMLK